MRCFCDNITTSATAKILSINRNAINACFNGFRIKILENFIKEHKKEFKVCELDESYYGHKEGKVSRENPVFNCYDNALLSQLLF